MVLRDIMCSGYVAGGNTKWFGNTNLSGPPSQSLDPQQVQSDINNRLAFTDDVNADYGSMLAFACPYKEVQSGARDQMISISERLLPWEVRSEPSGSGGLKSSGGFPGGNEGFNYYKDLFGLNSIHFGEDIRAAENMEFIANVSSNLIPLSISKKPYICTSPIFHGCASRIIVTFSGIGQQCHVHTWPAPQVRPFLAELLRACSRTGTLWSRCNPRSKRYTHTHTNTPALKHSQNSYYAFIVAGRSLASWRVGFS